MADATLHLRDHYEDLAKQTHAARLGMWVFIGSEALLFAALFALYAAYRIAYPASFRAAAAHTNLFLGTAMTFVLITSSLLMANAVLSARLARPGRSVGFLAGTAGLGIIFLGLKAVEYTEHFRDGIFPGAFYAFARLPAPGARVFFTLYYFMTGLHALHVAGGVVLLAWLARRAHRGGFTPEYHTPLELGGMYWHFVDVVWIFLWPLFYLLR
ncbi:MAG TPA: cytochrome c oxidase subunit 3 [Longimicrobiales bacterium]